MTITRNFSILAPGVSSAGVVAVANGGTGVTTSTGSGNVVLSTSPALSTPNIGTPSAGVLTNCTGLTYAGGGITGGTTLTTALTALGLGMPCFSAFAASSQTVTTMTSTKLVFGTEKFDSNNNFASSRFTATIAGYYIFTTSVRPGSTGASGAFLTFVKNGSDYLRFISSGGAQMPASIVVNMAVNDYAEIYGWIDGTEFNYANASVCSMFSGGLIAAT